MVRHYPRHTSSLPDGQSSSEYYKDQRIRRRLRIYEPLNHSKALKSPDINKPLDSLSRLAMVKASHDAGQEPITIDRVLPKYDRPWWRVKHLVLLNVCLLIPILGNSINGYDGSLLNGLQSLPQWRDYFHQPSGAYLGALSNAYVFGNILAFFAASWFSDKYGRLWTIRLGTIVVSIGSAIQAAAQDYAMFFVARLIIGAGAMLLIVACPCLISELAYPSHRGVATAVYGPSWYAGATVAAWVTFGTNYMGVGDSWAWRLPSLLQCLIPAIQLVGTLFIPESPRYLIDMGREQEARDILTKYHGGNDPANLPLVEFELNEIKIAIEHDKAGEEVTWASLVKTKANRHRLFVVIFLGITQQLCGNGLVSYYLNLILDSIGITSSREQLVINGSLMVYNLGTAVFCGFIVGRIPRRPTFLFGLGLMLICYVIWTVLSAINQQRHFEEKALGQGVLAMIFLFYATYNFCMNALPSLYITEVLPYYLRAKGTTTFCLVNGLTNVYNGFVNPVAMNAISWRYYIVFCCLLAVELTGIAIFFPETYGYSLEEAAEAFGDSALSTDPVEKTEVSHVDRVAN
jgi:sugar porter (SP) family MFS transporter